MAAWVYRILDRRSRLVAVTFHRVGPGLSATPEKIRNHLEFLARHYEMVAPTQLAEGRIPKRAAMVTIDDGHKDLFEHIFPVAQALGVPITVCAATDYVLRGRWLWFDMLDWICRNVVAGARAEVDGCVLEVGNAEVVQNLKRTLKRLLPVKRDIVLNSLATALGCRVPPGPTSGYEPMSRKDMDEMLASGLLELCAHTVSHTIATVLPEAELRREMSQSKRELEEIGGREVVSFCYPNGYEGDFSEATTTVARETGFKMAFTSVGGTNLVNGLDMYRIRRVHASLSQAGFEKEASGFGDFLVHAGTGSAFLNRVYLETAVSFNGAEGADKGVGEINEK